MSKKKLTPPSIDIKDSVAQAIVGKGVRVGAKVAEKQLKKKAEGAKRLGRQNIRASEEEIKKRQAINNAIRERQKKQSKKKPNLKEKLSKNRSQARHQEMDVRQRFGARGTHLGQEVVFFEEWNIATIEQEFENVKEKIKNQVLQKFQNKNQEFFIENLDKYKKKLEGDQEFFALCENYEFLRKERDRINSAIKARYEWQNWDAGNLPKESARKRILRHTETAISVVGGSLPVIGPIVSSGYKFYTQIKDFAVDILDNSINILSGTRRLSSGGRIASRFAGAVVGAAIVGGVFALISVLLPFLGIGVAVAGTAGIFAGALVGWNTGSKLGVGLFNWLSVYSRDLRAEADYQMEYRHLRQLRKLYGFDEKIVLKMYSYLSNQINLIGENGGEDLEKLRKAALEEGREASLARLCVYFLSQEKMLRSIFQDLAKESILNQKERLALLKQKMVLLENPNENKEKIEEIEKKLSDNHQELLVIANKRFQITRERDGILEILKEFKDPSEFYEAKSPEKGPIHVYNNMCLFNEKTGKRLLEKNTIENLFYTKSDMTRLETPFDELNESNMWPEEIVLPRDIRSFGGESQKALMERKEFMKDMKENGFKYLQKQAQQTKLKTIELYDFDKEITRAFHHCLDESNRILGFLRLGPPHDLAKLNKNLANNIFEMRKILQIIRDETFYPEIPKEIEKNIQQLEEVQFFLQILNRKNAPVPADSPIRDLIGHRSWSISKDSVENQKQTHDKPGDKPPAVPKNRK